MFRWIRFIGYGSAIWGKFDVDLLKASRSFRFAMRGSSKSVSESVWDSGKVETYLSCLLLPH